MRKPTPVTTASMMRVRWSTAKAKLTVEAGDGDPGAGDDLEGFAAGAEHGRPEPGDDACWKQGEEQGNGGDGGAGEDDGPGFR